MKALPSKIRNKESMSIDKKNNILGINLTKKVKVLYSENCKTLMGKQDDGVGRRQGRYLRPYTHQGSNYNKYS